MEPTLSTPLPTKTTTAAPTRRKPAGGWALSLSGGGYRAMLFHLGVLWRLNESGWLPRLSRISSVSGGSITAGTLALAWKRLAFDRDTNVSPAFHDLVVKPVRRMAGQHVDVTSVLLG